MCKLGILYICTGKYDIFWEDFYKSCEKYFLPHRYIDDRMIEIVMSLDISKKEEIERYFKSKIVK